MRLLALALVLSTAGCKDGSDADDYPVLPGGGPGGDFGDNPGADAAVDSVIGDGGTVTARVCLLADATQLRDCAATGAGGFVVTLASETATTLDDGTFTIQMPTSSNLVWKVESPTGSAVIVPSRMKFDTTNLIPAIPRALWDDMLSGSTATQADDTASIIIAFTDAQGVPVENVLVQTAATEQVVRYDDLVSPTAWQTDATGPAGLAWLTSVDATTSSVVLSADPPPTGGDDSVNVSVPVDQNAVTFARFAY